MLMGPCFVQKQNDFEENEFIERFGERLFF